MGWQQAIQRYGLLSAGDRVLAGVSGGPDSMALLHILQQAAEQYGCFLAVVHVDHQLRGEAAKREAEFVAKWCRTLDIPCTVYTRDVQALAKARGLSLEAAGHEVRFAAFRQAQARFGANKLALGHHRDDRAETVLLHLLQGTGLDGLAALPPQEGWIIRPLIEATKSELIAYCEAQALPYFLDASNEDTSYLRNRIRHQLLPLLAQEYNPKIRQALLRLAETAEEDSRYLKEQADQAWKACACSSSEDVTIDLNKWRELPPALKRRVLRQSYVTLVGGGQGLSYQQTEAVFHLAQADKGEKRLSLPGGIMAFKSYTELVLTRQKAKTPDGYELTWSLEAPLDLPDGRQLTVEWSDTPLSYNGDFTQVLLDADRLPKVLTVRTRRPGDELRPLGMQGKKKLKTYFIDKKVPQAARDSWPLVLGAGELIWLPGLTIAEGWQATKNTEKFCRLTLIWSEEAGFLLKAHETN